MNTKKVVLILGALLTTSAVVLQCYLAILNRTVPVPEALIRFITYFTILTNSIVAAYFISLAFFSNSKWAHFFSRISVATAICTYITLVGLTYQFILRGTWEPTGLQRIVDEMLHSLNPAFFLLYWLFVLHKASIAWKRILSWMIYPLVYFAVIILRGKLSGFYPYPFVDVEQIGMQRVLINALVIVGVFAILASVFVLISRSIKSPT